MSSNECLKCNKLFKRGSGLYRHQRQINCDGSNPIEKLECQKCKKLFSRKDHLNRHTISHLPCLTTADTNVEQETKKNKQNSGSELMQELWKCTECEKILTRKPMT